jgi:hypothetical protein
MAIKIENCCLISGGITERTVVSVNAYGDRHHARLLEEIRELRRQLAEK